MTRDDPMRLLKECFISPNETDSNYEAANVVDGLFRIARALDGVAQAILLATETLKESK